MHVGDREGEAEAEAMEVEELKTMYLALAGARVKHHFIFGATPSPMLAARVLTFQTTMKK